MTREEAVTLLRKYRRETRISPLYVPFFRNDYRMERYVLDRYLTKGLIREIGNSDSNPISIIQEAYWNVDDLILESSNPYTNHFARMVQCSLGDILEFLLENERKRSGQSMGEKLVRDVLLNRHDAGCNPSETL